MFISFTSADKITKIYAIYQKYLHICEKSSTFAAAFGNYGSHNTTLRSASAIVAQLVEQRIRNAWVAGSSPASGSKKKKTSFMGVFLFCHLSRTRTVKGSPKRSWRFGEERVILECLMPLSGSLCTKVWRAAESGQWLKKKKTSFMGVFLFCHLSRTRTVKVPYTHICRKLPLFDITRKQKVQLFCS